MTRKAMEVKVGGSRVVEKKDAEKVSKKVKPKAKDKPAEDKGNAN